MHPACKDWTFSDENTILYSATQPSALLHHRESLLKCGGYNQDFYPMEYIFCALRVAQRFGIAHYNKFTNFKRIDFSEGVRRNLCFQYSLQHYYFVKDCTPYNDVFKDFYLRYLLCWSLESMPQNKALVDDFCVQYKISTTFNFYEKILIYCVLCVEKIKYFFKRSR